MLIKYLKNTHDSITGDVKNVSDAQAEVLIKLQIAEKFSENAEKIEKKPRKTAKES